MAKESTTENKPLLDLSTVLAERPSIVIDKKIYFLSVANDFDLRDRHRITGYSKQMNELQDREGDLSEEDAGTLDGIFRSFVSLVVWDIPADVVQKLSINQCAEIALVFTEAAGFPKVENPLQEKKEEGQEKKPTGEKSSPGSSDSTEETSKDG